jgi:hypothetical protein
MNAAVKRNAAASANGRDMRKFYPFGRLLELAARVLVVTTVSTGVQETRRHQKTYLLIS